MKKSILLFFGLFMSLLSMAQLSVSTTPENKRGLLEEFTGMYCTFCPDGHVRAQNIKNSLGDNFWVINIHVGGFAAPTGGDPDFRTPFGTAIANQSGLCGYPAGTINRREFAGLAQTGTNCTASTAMGRSNWQNATNQVRAQAAYVNVAMEAQVDEQTRELRVITQYYYTDTGAVVNNLNIALLQNNVEGPQTGAATYNPGGILPNGNYNHQHMLRHMLTGQWGVAIPNTMMGTMATDTFYYTIPAALNGVDYDLSNLEVVAFVVEGQEEVINATGADVTVVNIANVLDAAILEMEEIEDVCPGANSASPQIRIRNNGSTTIDSIEFTYSVNGGTASTYTWTGSLAYGQSQYVTMPVTNYTAAASNSYDLTVTAVNGVADNVSTNNTVSNTFNSATETTKSNITIKITLDGYGSETSWTLKNSAGTTVASSPTYSDGTSGQNYPQPDINVTLPNDCYTFQINDSYGDGMCCGYGNGSYAIWADGVLIPGMSGGSFDEVDLRKFTVNATTTSVVEAVVTNISMFPNPASTEVSINFENAVNDATVNVIDLQGRVLISENVNNTNFHKLNISDLANGMYMVVISADGKVISEKLSVLK